eukprot:793541_1
MSTLPTIIEERTSTSTSKPMLCATFDFNTFSLGTQFLSIDELRYKKRHLSPNNAITPHAIQEYTSNHTTITIIKLSPHQLKKFTYAKIPTINNTKSIYLYKLHTNNNKYYLYISFTNKHSPKQCKNININNLINKTKSIKTVKLLPISFHGMALAIIYQKMGTKSNNYIIDGILYHAHNSKVYKHLNPQQDQKNKQETINNGHNPTAEYSTYKLNKKTRIKSLSHLSKYKCHGTNRTKSKRKSKSQNSGESSMFLLQKSHSRSVSNSSISSIGSNSESLSFVYDAPLQPICESIS